VKSANAKCGDRNGWQRRIVDEIKCCFGVWREWVGVLFLGKRENEEKMNLAIGENIAKVEVDCSKGRKIGQCRIKGQGMNAISSFEHQK
jgi:hypothetical protein